MLRGFLLRFGGIATPTQNPAIPDEYCAYRHLAALTGFSGVAQSFPHPPLISGERAKFFRIFRLRPFYR
jgi:hypothetical protein